MRRSAVLGVLLVIAGAAAVSAHSAVHPKVTRAQAVKRLRGMLGAKPKRVRLIWATEGLKDVVLEWTGYSAHARYRNPGGGPVLKSGKVKPLTFIHGPTNAWLYANGKPGFERLTVNHQRHHAHRYAFPERTYFLPVTLVEKLAKENLRVSLAPIRPLPGVSRKLALKRLRGKGLQPRQIWLVITHGHTAWLAATGNGRYTLLDTSR